MGLLQLVQDERLIAIVRGIPEALQDDTAAALVEGGVRLLEVTMNTEGALKSIGRWRSRYGGNGIRVGAGTVLTVSMAKEAVAAGAEFLISPNLDEEVLAYGLEAGLEVWPGTMTPTEIVRAWKLGASAVKVFPMGALGVAYLKEIRAPLNNIPMIATGGVTLGNVQEFFKAGAVAVGVGGKLVDSALIRDGQFDALRENAAAFVAAVRGTERG